MARPRGLPKTGGRKAGTLNRTNSSQIEKIQNLCDSFKLDPFEALLKLSSDLSLDINLRVGILKEIAQYVYPKRKSIEIDAELEINSAPLIQIYLPDNGTHEN